MMLNNLNYWHGTPSMPEAQIFAHSIIARTFLYLIYFNLKGADYPKTFREQLVFSTADWHTFSIGIPLNSPARLPFEMNFTDAFFKGTKSIKDNRNNIKNIEALVVMKMMDDIEKLFKLDVRDRDNQLYVMNIFNRCYQAALTWLDDISNPNDKNLNRITQVSEEIKDLL
jgi:hypothetical protein